MEFEIDLSNILNSIKLRWSIIQQLKMWLILILALVTFYPYSADSSGARSTG